MNVIYSLFGTHIYLLKFYILLCYIFMFYGIFQLVNSTRLMNLLTSDPNITSRLTRADCIVVLFYARTCPFSCMAAPHFNALPRAFPAIKMAAVNAIQHHRWLISVFIYQYIPYILFFFPPITCGTDAMGKWLSYSIKK